MYVDALSTAQTPYAFISKKSLFSVLNIMNSLKLDYLELELKHGADVNETEPEFNLNFLQKCIIDEYSLHEKNGEEFAKMVQLLLDYGIDVNHQDDDLCMALHYAIGEEQYELAKILLKNGANPAIVDKNGETALYDLQNLVGADPLKADQRQEMIAYLQPN